MVDAVELRTNDPSKRLSLANIRLAGDREYLVSDLQILSLGFSCSHAFYFDRFHAERTIADLREMDRGVLTATVLRQEWEEDHVAFANDRFGHVFVSGEMVLSDPLHRLRFTLATDQTVLRPFADGLQQALGAAQ